MDTIKFTCISPNQDHKVEVLNATIFFRVPALVVALYIGGGLSLSLTAGRGGGRGGRGGLVMTLVRGLLGLLAGVTATAAGVALGAGLVGGGALLLSRQGDQWAAEAEHSWPLQSGEEGEGEGELLLPPWPPAPAQASLYALVPAMLLLVLLLYFACFFSSPPAQPRPAPSPSLDRLLLALPLLFYSAINAAVLLRALGLDPTVHAAEQGAAAGGGGGGGLDDLNNLHAELAAPARAFVALNSLLALWTSLGGCYCYTPAAATHNDTDADMDTDMMDAGATRKQHAE
jgi:hypothetical protein